MSRKGGETWGTPIELVSLSEKENRAGLPGFSWRRVGCVYIAARRDWLKAGVWLG
jgi:hypothetical protein